MSTAAASGERAAQVIPIVVAPSFRANSTAPSA
jgi:hypothetical protein